MARPSRLVVVVATFLLFLVLLGWMNIIANRKQFDVPPHDYPIDHTDLLPHFTPPVRNTTVLLLFWTPVFGNIVSPRYQVPCSDFPGLHYTLTSDRSLLSEASAILFHGQDFNPWSDVPVRRIDQPWVLRSMESPENDRYHVDRSNPDKTGWFNLSMNYRRDADAWIPYMPMDAVERVMRPVILTKNRNQEVPIVWVCGNCHTNNGRELYVQELMKHIRVDSFGWCLKNADWDDEQLGRGRNNTAFYEFLRFYKFYLAFENSNCEDYITEKYWRTLELGLVPIVMGSPTISSFEPTSRSIIRVEDFQSPRQLAKYVQLLHENDGLYEQYMSFKNPSSPFFPPLDPAHVLLPSFLQLFKIPRAECALAHAVKSLKDSGRTGVIVPQDTSCTSGNVNWPMTMASSDPDDESDIPVSSFF